ncbi:hypothetical protein J31TS4_39140 [Paenibacillus sp. J31TS4]|uniref:DUF4446 family protein n=1 Tax=Paenibacillus sp. J31TS4 TaxID=2807195 RepID=UPI001B02CC46|nr:DUF4446 family protein [Paenibacillus sp. J31TS4]GIP40634.1 hypothetical protein J31TS4_39140 [Paenibacillus sp. J31TS4]
MQTIFGLEPEVWASIQVLAFAVLFLMVLILWIKFRKVNKRYKKMMSGAEGNLEEILLQLQEAYRQTGAASEDQGAAIRQLQEQVKGIKGRVGVIRYNAFAQHSSDLSFSLAILDDYKNGLVLTGIHSRNETFLYAKPLEQGRSKYSLSPEEEKVIQLVSEQKGQ